MTYRPFLTYEEQIDKLVNEYGLVIKDRCFALEALSSLSYYDLINGYKETYMSDNKFIANVSIEYLTMIHIFNKNIQSVLLKYATYIETTFKTALSYEISSNIGIEKDDYLDMQNYRRLRKIKDRDKFNKTVRNIKKAFGSSYYSANNPTKHYLETKDHVPPWILLKNVSFSDSTNWYSFLKVNSKENILDSIMPYRDLSFDERNEIFTNSLILIRKFRNVIAHNLKFITYKIKDPKKIPKEINYLFENTLVYSNEINTPRDDAWGMILCMIALINNNKLKKDFITDLIHYFDKPMEIIQGEPVYLLGEYCLLTNLPEDIMERLINYLNFLDNSSDTEYLL